MSRKFEGNANGSDKDEETLGSFYMGRMQPPPENERVLPRGLLATIVIIAFAGILWYAYPESSENYDAADVPVIKADAQTYKFTPDDPGGMEVRHQDSTVFNPLVKKPTESVERLLPKPEEPLNKQDAIQAGDTAPAVKTAGKAGLNLEPAPEDGGAGAEKVVDTTKAPTLTELATAKTQDAPIEKVEEKKEAAKPVEKAEVKAEPKAEEKKEAVSTGASGFYMQLGAFRDTAKVDAEWSKLQKKFPTSLGGLSKRIEKADLGAKGTWYRLHAGPVAEGKARDICASLKADGAGCMVRKL